MLLCSTPVTLSLSLASTLKLCSDCLLLIFPQSVSKILDVASLEALNECNRRSLKKLASQADSMEQVDDTILT